MNVQTYPCGYGGISVCECVSVCGMRMSVSDPG